MLGEGIGGWRGREVVQRGRDVREKGREVGVRGEGSGDCLPPVHPLYITCLATTGSSSFRFSSSGHITFIQSRINVTLLRRKCYVDTTPCSRWDIMNISRIFFVFVKMINTRPNVRKISVFCVDFNGNRHSRPMEAAAIVWCTCICRALLSWVTHSHFRNNLYCHSNHEGQFSVTCESMYTKYSLTGRELSLSRKSVSKLNDRLDMTLTVLTGS